MPLLRFTDYIPDGGTALDDAIGRTIQAIGRKATRLTPVVVIIITDGGDTSSRQFSTADVRQMVSYRRRSHDWEFLFLVSEVRAEIRGINRNPGRSHIQLRSRRCRRCSDPRQVRSEPGSIPRWRFKLHPSPAIRGRKGVTPPLSNINSKLLL